MVREHECEWYCIGSVCLCAEWWFFHNDGGWGNNGNDNDVDSGGGIFEGKYSCKIFNISPALGNERNYFLRADFSARMYRLSTNNPNIIEERKKERKGDTH